MDKYSQWPPWTRIAFFQQLADSSRWCGRTYEQCISQSRRCILSCWMVSLRDSWKCECERKEVKSDGEIGRSFP